MNIPRVDDVLEMCEQHLSSTDSYGTQIEAVLTSYASSVIYSSFEARAREIIAARAGGDGTDKNLANFARVASVRLMRSIKVSELTGIAAWFHADCKERLKLALEDEVIDAWHTIISNRHDLAHEDSAGAELNNVSNLTFGELRSLYPKAVFVLDCLTEAIRKVT